MPVWIPAQDVWPVMEDSDSQVLGNGYDPTFASQGDLWALISFPPVVKCLLHSPVSDLCSHFNLVDAIIGNWDLFNPPPPRCLNL